MKKVIAFCFPLFYFPSVAQPTPGFQIIERKDKKQIDILWKGRQLTAYCYYDSIRKPFLFPLNTLDGITVTRGYPIRPKTGERTDHPHHTGLWMNYESVNGLDFWNNSTAIPVEKRNSYGTIRHRRVISRQMERNRARLQTLSDWLHPDGHVILTERTAFDFIVQDSLFFIQRTATLTAAENVVFKDTKDGFIAIRVARELEMPSSQKDVFVDMHGNKTDVPRLNNEGVTGRYSNSEGVTGDSVWSSQARWAKLKGRIGDKEITIGMFDHPSNVGYPGYWHARGYGLFAFNPLGRKVFSNGREELNFSMKKGESTVFRYLVLIAAGKDLDVTRMNAIADAFAGNDLAQAEDVVAPGATLQLLSGQFAFTEGPAVNKRGDVFFTDQPNDRIWKYSADGKLELFMEGTGRSNGMYFDRQDNLWTCADENNEIWKISPGKKVTIFLTSKKAPYLNGPNDLWIHPSGSIYFTDPLYERPYWKEKKERIVGKHVYLLPKGAVKPIPVDTGLVQPNGIIGSPDGRHLYVADINAGKTYRYVIEKNGKLSNRQLFTEQGSDGMTIDEKGHIYLTGDGVTVYNEKGDKLRHIAVPAKWTANVCFGGKNRDKLFITASEAVYTLQMTVKGVQ